MARINAAVTINEIKESKWRLSVRVDVSVSLCVCVCVFMCVIRLPRRRGWVDSAQSNTASFNWLGRIGN